MFLIGLPEELNLFIRIYFGFRDYLLMVTQKQADQMGISWLFRMFLIGWPVHLFCSFVIKLVLR